MAGFPVCVILGGGGGVRMERNMCKDFGSFTENFLSYFSNLENASKEYFAQIKPEYLKITTDFSNIITTLDFSNIIKTLKLFWVLSKYKFFKVEDFEEEKFSFSDVKKVLNDLFSTLTKHKKSFDSYEFYLSIIYWKSEKEGNFYFDNPEKLSIIKDPSFVKDIIDSFYVQNEISILLYGDKKDLVSNYFGLNLHKDKTHIASINVDFGFKVFPLL